MPKSAQSPRLEILQAHFLDDHSSHAPGLSVVEPAPDEPQAKRGNLYLLVELMGESPFRAQALRRLQTTVTETYYKAAGSVSTILESAITAAHAELAQMNQRSPETELRAGVICAVVVDNLLIMAAAGPSLALISTQQRVDQFPPGPRHYTSPLGGATPPQISIYKQPLQAGDAIFLGESDWILLTTVKVLGGAVANATRENRFDVVDYLRRQSNQAEILGVLLLVEDPTLVRPAPVPRRADNSGLPTAVGATPPVRGVPTVDEGIPAVWDADVRAAAPQNPRQRPQSQPLLPAPRAREIPAASVEVIAPGDEPAPSPRRRRRTPPPWAQVVDNLSAVAQQSQKQIGQFIQRILPERDRTPQEPPDWVGTLPDLSQTHVGPTLAVEPFTPPARTRDGRARLFILLALLIPLLTFATVGAVYLRQGADNQSEGIKLVELAEAQLLKAQQALGVDDKSTARAALGEAQRYLSEAIDLIGITERIRDLSGRIQTELQSLLQVRSLYSLDFPLVRFPADADPHRVVVFDQDVYVLDVGRQVVEYFRTDASRTLIEEARGIIVREGDVVEGVTVGRLVDIAWQPRIPGFADKASLLILDRNNNIFRYNNVDETTYVRLTGAEQFRGISQLESYGGRLYLVDEQQSQVWRYSPAGLGYDEPPAPWFASGVQVNLAGVVATGIDGDIWMLMEDGTILRYRQGQQLPFSLDTSAGLTGRMVDMTLGTAAEDNLYMADGNLDRILVFDKEGNYLEQFQAAENNALRGLRGLYLDNVTGTLFILTQSSLFAHSLPR